MPYVDMFVAAVPVANRESYLDHTRRCSAIFQRHGVLSHVECWGEDIPEGTLTDYRRAVAAEDGEQIVCGWMTWPDRAARDKGWQAIMEDPDMQTEGHAMPFDGKRMIFGGFGVIHDARS